MNNNKRYYNKYYKNVVVVDGVLFSTKVFTFGYEEKREGVIIMVRHYYPNDSNRFVVFKLFAFGQLKDAIITHADKMMKKKISCVGHVAQFAKDTNIILDYVCSKDISAFGINENVPVDSFIYTDNPIKINEENSDFDDGSIEYDIDPNDLPF